jgi:hypothetical protein
MRSTKMAVHNENITHSPMNAPPSSAIVTVIPPATALPTAVAAAAPGSFEASASSNNACPRFT